MDPDRFKSLQEWAASDEAYEALREALARAAALSRERARERRFDPRLLHEPIDV